jgi:hypothetical protein
LLSLLFVAFSLLLSAPAIAAEHSLDLPSPFLQTLEQMRNAR